MQKKFKTQYNAEKFPTREENKAGSEPSQTVPDMALSIRDLLRRQTQGLPLSGRQGEYDPEDGEDEFYAIPGFANMDLAEKEELARLAGEEVQRLRGILNEKAAAKRAADEATAKEQQRKEWEAEQEKEAEKAAKQRRQRLSDLGRDSTNIS